MFLKSFISYSRLNKSSKTSRQKNKQKAEVLCADSTKEIEYVFYLLRLNMLTDDEVTKIIDFEEQRDVLLELLISN